MSRGVLVGSVLVLGGAAILGSAACTEEAQSYSKRPFEEGETLGGEEVSAETLNDGWEGYILNCRQCHGDAGDGNGVSAVGLRPPPRDFTKAMFKFGGVRAGELPHDEDLIRIVKGGLHGTAMLKWDVEDRELHAILQYVKWLGRARWSKEPPGERVRPTKDPWEGREREAVKMGARVYHVDAQCGGCHPNYATKQELDDFNVAAGRGHVTDFRSNLYGADARDSEYRVDGKVLKILPPDFLTYRVRTMPEGGEGVSDREQLDALYVTIASGIGGTPMPVWKDALPEDKFWAMVHYVRSLVQMRDTQEGRALRERLEARENMGWRPPPPPPEPTPAEATAAPATARPAWTARPGPVKAPAKAPAKAPPAP